MVPAFGCVSPTNFDRRCSALASLISHDQAAALIPDVHNIPVALDVAGVILTPARTSPCFVGDAKCANSFEERMSHICHNSSACRRLDAIMSERMRGHMYKTCTATVILRISPSECED